MDVKNLKEKLIPQMVVAQAQAAAAQAKMAKVSGGGLGGYAEEEMAYMDSPNEEHAQVLHGLAMEILDSLSPLDDWSIERLRPDLSLVVTVNDMQFIMSIAPTDPGPFLTFRFGFRPEETAKHGGMMLGGSGPPRRRMLKRMKQRQDEFFSFSDPSLFQHILDRIEYLKMANKSSLLDDFFDKQFQGSYI